MTLTAIGNEMRQRLANVEKGYISKALFGGLVLVMERRGDQWRLAVGRTTAPPSVTEVQTIERDLALPAGVNWSWTLKRKPKTKATYHVAECTWTEGGHDASQVQTKGHP